MNTVAVLQPGYLPWLGFFDQMRRATHFVYYDDVQFDKHGWRNRNRIKTPQGPQWLTVPVRHKGLGPVAIREVEIDGQHAWARKHLGAVRQHYGRAPFFERYFPVLTTLLEKKHRYLIDLDCALVEWLRGELGIGTRVLMASSLGVSGDKSGRLVNICQRLEASRYLSGNAAQDYLDVALFSENGIKVEWQNYQHPVYPQQYAGFEPYLSVIDLLLNTGPQAAGYIANEVSE